MTRTLAACLAILLAGCGGKVVFAEDGGEGGGSSSSSPSSAAGTEKFEPGPQPDPRGDLCKQVCNSCDTTPDCVEECLTAFGAGCDAAAADYLQCVGDSFVPSTCEYTETCDAEAEAWVSCPMNLCSDGCSKAESDCACLRTCDDVELQMACTLVGDAQATCDCKVDGVVVTSCNETHLACDLDFGCCASAFGF